MNISNVTGLVLALLTNFLTSFGGERVGRGWRQGGEKVERGWGMVSGD
jgi:hypothetical protein